MEGKITWKFPSEEDFQDTWAEYVSRSRAPPPPPPPSVQAYC